MRLIDADALLNDISDLKKSPWFHENYFDHKNIRKEAIEIVEQLCIDKAPTIDAVQVVRCKDCKYWVKDTLRHNSNDVAEWDECECEMLANRDRWNEIDRYCCDVHFCADGEMKDNE